MGTPKEQGKQKDEKEGAKGTQSLKRERRGKIGDKNGGGDAEKMLLMGETGQQSKGDEQSDEEGASTGDGVQEQKVGKGLERRLTVEVGGR